MCLCVHPFSHEGGINLFGDHRGSVISKIVRPPIAMEVPYRQPWRAHTVAVDGPYGIGSCGGTVQLDMEKDIKKIYAQGL